MRKNRLSTGIITGLLALGACGVDADLQAPPAASTRAQVGDATEAVNRGGSGGASNTPIDYGDPDLKCYLLRAFESVENKAGKYAVVSRPDFYVGFNIKAPWTTTQYIRSIRSLVDNRSVLHHWVLYKQGTGLPEEIVEGTIGAHPEGVPLYAWAPGTDDMWLDPDVGMEVTPDTVFQVENHYNNVSGAPVRDGSGVEVCVTPHRPAHLAAMSFVGTDTIKGTRASGTCTPQSTEPVHLIVALPHMHKKGIHFKVDWTHADGTSETVYDAPFDFDYQRTYTFSNLTLLPGDKLTTSCTFDSPAKFGKGTSDEMCYLFSIHWPAGALSNDNFFTQLHGPNTCIDMPPGAVAPPSPAPLTSPQ